MHDSRPSDRTPVHYTMKTPARHSAITSSQPHTHSHPHSHAHSHTHTHSHSESHTHTLALTSLSHPQSLRASKPPKSSTPIASPRMPYSVGQSAPPKLSPRVIPENRAPSPNYFGLVIESSNDPRDSSSGLPKDTWSPSSSIKSFAAAIPKQVPLDANPEFEAFKRQADLNRGKSFALSTSHYALPSAPIRPRPPRWHTHSSETGGQSPFGRAFGAVKERPSSRMELDHESNNDSAYVSSDSKRNSESSIHPLPTSNPVRFESPRQMDPPAQRTTLTRSEDRDPRLSVMEHRLDPPSPGFGNLRRAETVPVSIEPGEPVMISGAQLRDMLRNAGSSRLLILDIRSSQNYANSRVEGALNLCIPTTLLKRATFNIQKLQQTFSQGGTCADKFARWKEMDSIVVYDAHSSDKRDAVTAQNMIKKFTNEGYNGGIYILRGGFVSFQQQYPDLVDRKSTVEGSSRSCTSQGGGIAPVIGGVMLPTTNKDQNPFFSNIRQNMDLADGVGQLDVARPSDLDSPSLPRWLREAASERDHGKKVSDKFLHIEVDEQSRMKAAYAAFNPNHNSQPEVQLCGVEKGGKNRYKDILPFEHARVRLQDKPQGCCDYVNASHLKASRSNKRYIATQGPLPTTFEDFWSVIWEQDVRVIVMLTAESEGGQLKCHPYWKSRDFGAIRLKPLSEKRVSLDIDKHKSDPHSNGASASAGEHGRRRANTTTTLGSAGPNPNTSQTQRDVPYVIIRKFALSHQSHPFAPIREITHLHFPSWPDFGTPAQPSHLLALVELANVMQRSALPIETTSVVGARKSPLEHAPITWYDEPESSAHARPMLVHCSAGCGRTGAFCTVDSVIDMLKRQQQAKVSASMSHDADGDVSMNDSAKEIASWAQKKTYFDAKLATEKRMTRSSSLDTSFVFDDTVDLIQRTVEDFRGQRLSMVQSLRQYVLCYETILEWASRMNDRGSAVHGGRMRSGSLQQPHC